MTNKGRAAPAPQSRTITNRRNATTGRFTTPAEVKRNPSGTTTERTKVPVKK